MPSDFVHGKLVDVRAARQQELNRPLLRALHNEVRPRHHVCARLRRRIDSVERTRN